MAPPTLVFATGRPGPLLFLREHQPAGARISLRGADESHEDALGSALVCSATQGSR